MSVVFVLIPLTGFASASFSYFYNQKFSCLISMVHRG